MSLQQLSADALALQNTARTVSAELPAAAARFGETWQDFVRSGKEQVMPLAVATYNEGNVFAAEQICRLIIEKSGPDIRALHLLATIARQLGHHEDAVDLLFRCLDINPNLPFVHFDLANAFFRSGRFQLALDRCNALLTAEPENADYRALKAGSLIKLGQYDAAIEEFEKLLQVAPDDPQVLLRFGIALRIVGRGDDAIAAFRKSIQQQPGNGEAYWNLANLKTFKFDPMDLAAMRAAVAAKELTAANRSFFLFALGKATEDTGEYDAAFAHYAEANAIAKQIGSYDPDRISRFVDRCVTTFSEDYFAKRSKACDAVDPIFIVGLPRSGSTLLEQILSRHSEIDATMELSEIPAMVRSLDNPNRSGNPAQFPEIMSALKPDELERLGNEYLKRTRCYRGDKRLFIDKTPHNVLHIGLIASILPNAKIIDARRSPYATGLSIFQQHFATGTGYAYDLAHIGRYYADYLRLMEHWNRVLPGRILTVQYEDVVSDTELEVRKILDYCDIAFEADCLEFYRSTRAVATVSSEQVRKPVYRTALEHWKHYEKQLAPLKEALERYAT